MTRMRIGPVRPAKRSAGGATALMSRRTGLPITRACTSRPKLPGKASSTWRARCARQRLVKPAIGVLLVDDERAARQPRGHPARSGDEAPESDHHARLVTAHDRERLQQRAAEAKRRGEPGERALAAQAPDRELLDGDALGRDDARLEAALGAEPDDLGRLFAQQARERERREHVPAGAAGHDEDGSAHAAPRTVAEPRCSRIAS